MKDYKAISEKAFELIEYQKKIIYQLNKQPNSIGREWRERVEGLEVIIDTFTKQLSELKVLEQSEVNINSETIHDINFIKWYSGMEEQKIRNAFERYKREAKIKRAITKK